MLKKSQTTLEFTIIIGFLMFMLVVFVAGVVKQHVDLVEKTHYVVVKDIAYKIREEITIAHRVEPVYYRNFTIPSTVEGVSYTVAVNGNVVIVESELQEFSLMVPKVNGCIHLGNNSVRKLVNGTVVFECI